MLKLKLLQLRSFSVHHFYGVFIAPAQSHWASISVSAAAQKFRPRSATNDGGEIHFGKVICGIVLMSNQAVPPCYLARAQKEEAAVREPKNQGGGEPPASN